MLDGELIPGFLPRSDPMTLAAATVFLPTRRAARAFEYAILDALGTDASLLPRIVPLGDLDEDAFAFSEEQPEENVLPAVSANERRLVLARLVAGFSESRMIAASPASSIKLADELARFFDDLTIAGIPIEKLEDADLVPLNLDEFWQKSLEFLKIAHRAWRGYLAERGKADPTVHRDLLLARKADDLRKRKGGPFIAAGSTGTIPAVANLLVAISEREDGAVILPGLDQKLDENSFRMIQGIETDTVKIDASFGHPQFGLSRLLTKLKIPRGEVRPLGGETRSEKEIFLSEAFRPAESSDLWNTRQERLPESEANKAIENISLIEAADPREEALAAAIVLRQSAEAKRRRTAFVTHDRALARRVAAELRRWNINVDDSAGIPLAESEAGRFARLLAAAAAETLSPVTLLAFLRHPLNNLTVETGSVDALELAVLRGPRPAAGADGLIRAIENSRSRKHHHRDPRAKLGDAKWDAALKLARKTAKALDPLLLFAGRKNVACGELISAHRECLSQCGLVFTHESLNGAFELGEVLTVLEQTAAALELDLGAYAGAFSELLRGETVRRDFDPDERIRILGPLEARLLQADQILIGGLNEGSWPPETHSDAWLNRPLRKKLGLDLPERRIGLTAHDFVQALGTDNVILSRAKKQNGVETVASRFLQRLSAIAPADAWNAAKLRGENLLDISRALENRIDTDPIQRPAPKPPASARPVQLSVTDIEKLVRDPYSIYARDVLKLTPLEELDADPGAADRGTIIHDAFAEFALAAPKALPKDALEQLLSAGRKAFLKIDDYPELRAIWWPRFMRAAEWMIGKEEELRKGIEQVFSEIGGAIEFEAGGRMFKLTARVDRIDRYQNSAIAIFDYKTGSSPSLKQMLTGLAPQLPLEAAIARAGGFNKIKDVKATAGIFVLAVSGGQPPGKLVSFDLAREKSVEVKTFDDLADFAREKMEALVKTFADQTTPYLSIPRPKWRGRFGEYDHLARIKEWSANEEGAE